ncbi:DDB1- and CUL4-associated factor 4 [Batrachochytrium dendrobatidis]|nr:DDB1- and CUL4-associated factor 4 [Batrachochytrium dendrobatidis]KAK5665120.1 DDB1- and CUL4-associated factor 4 [Batrachochytrium dendrobatidis]
MSYRKSCSSAQKTTRKRPSRSNKHSSLQSSDVSQDHRESERKWRLENMQLQMAQKPKQSETASDHPTASASASASASTSTIPGYYYDTDRNRYFKITQDKHATTSHVQKYSHGALASMSLEQKQDAACLNLELRRKTKMNPNRRVSSMCYNSMPLAMLDREISKKISSSNIYECMYSHLHRNGSILTQAIHGEMYEQEPKITGFSIDQTKQWAVTTFDNRNMYIFHLNHITRSSPLKSACVQSKLLASLSSNSTSLISGSVLDRQFVGVTTRGNALDSDELHIFIAHSEQHQPIAYRGDNLLNINWLKWRYKLDNPVSVKCSTVDTRFNHLIALGASHGNTLIFPSWMHGNLTPQVYTGSSSSDIMSVCFDVHTPLLLYTGTRSGLIRAHDIRQSRTKSPLFTMSSKVTGHPSCMTSLVSLNSVYGDTDEVEEGYARPHQLISTSLNGQIYLWDIRTPTIPLIDFQAPLEHHGASGWNGSSTYAHSAHGSVVMAVTDNGDWLRTWSLRNGLLMGSWRISTGSNPLSSIQLDSEYGVWICNGSSIHHWESLY